MRLLRKAVMQTVDADLFKISKLHSKLVRPSKLNSDGIGYNNIYPWQIVYKTDPIAKMSFSLSAY